MTKYFSLQGAPITDPGTSPITKRKAMNENPIPSEPKFENWDRWRAIPPGTWFCLVNSPDPIDRAYLKLSGSCDHDVADMKTGSCYTITDLVDMYGEADLLDQIAVNMTTNITPEIKSRQETDP